MISTHDMFGFGILSAKSADYLTSNKMSKEDKKILTTLDFLNSTIKLAALDNKTFAEYPMVFTLEEVDIMNAARALLEEIGYDIELEVLTTPIQPQKAIYNFKIRWEM